MAEDFAPNLDDIEVFATTNDVNNQAQYRASSTALLPSRERNKSPAVAATSAFTRRSHDLAPDDGIERVGNLAKGTVAGTSDDTKFTTDDIARTQNQLLSTKTQKASEAAMAYHANDRAALAGAARPRKVTVIDVDGDIMLPTYTRDGIITYRVNSQVIENRLPLFRYKAEESWTDPKDRDLDLSHSRSDMVTTLFRMAHYGANEYSEPPGWEPLAELVALYVHSELRDVAIFKRLRQEVMQYHLLLGQRFGGCFPLLFVAWKLNFRPLFAKVMQHASENATREGDALVIQGRKSICASAYPPSSLDDPELHCDIRGMRLNRLTALSTLLKDFSRFELWLETAKCRRSDTQRPADIHNCCLVRYGAFQAAIGQYFDKLRSSPVNISSSFRSNVQQLLQIESLVINHGHLELGGMPSVKVREAASFGRGHEECDFQAFRDAIYALFEPDQLQLNHSDLISECYDRSFDDAQDPDEDFGSLLHPCAGLFSKFDRPTVEEHRRYCEAAARNKKHARFPRGLRQRRELNSEAQSVSSGSGYLPAEYINLEVGAADTPQENLFVSPATAASPPTPHPTKEPAAAATSSRSSYTASEAGAEALLESENEIDMYDDDFVSDASTEPDEEYISDDEALRTLRGLRMSEMWREEVRKRVYIELCSESESEAETAKKNEERTARREAETAKKNEEKMARREAKREAKKDAKKDAKKEAEGPLKRKLSKLDSDEASVEEQPKKKINKRGCRGSGRGSGRRAREVKPEV